MQILELNRNNKFTLYKKYIQNPNNNKNLNKFKSNESNLITMNYSINNITNVTNSNVI